MLWAKPTLYFFRLCSTRCTTGNFHNTKFGHGSWPQITFSGRFGQWCVKEHLTVSRSIWQSHRNMMLQSYFQEKKGCVHAMSRRHVVWKGFRKNRQEGVPEILSSRKGHDMLSGRGSWHAVRKGFLTCCQEEVRDILSGRGSWHVVVQKGLMTCCQEGVHTISSGKGSKHVVRKGFKACR